MSPAKKTPKRTPRKTAAAKKPSASTNNGAFRAVMRERKVDLLSVFLIALGVLSALGIYLSAAGPLGDALNAMARGVFGLAGYLLPIALVAVGITSVIQKDEKPEAGRLTIGLVVFAAGALTLLHLALGMPDPFASPRDVWPAGGWFGWLVATPLIMIASTWGAGVVAVALAVLGILIVTKTPLATIADGFRRGVTAVGRKFRERTVDTPTSTSSNGTPPTVAGNPGASRAVLDLDDTTEAAPVAAGVSDGGNKEVEPAIAPPVDLGVKKAKKVRPNADYTQYQLPPLHLLAEGRKIGAESSRTIDAQTAALQETFRQFGVDATVARWSRGPTVTRFEIELGPGVQVKKVANMGDDIAYALAAQDVRIVAPIPGKSAIGVEVPNRQRDLVTLGDILRSPEAAAETHPLSVALGVDIAGKPIVINLATMPHLLVSGATGSGKSVTLNGMIHSLIMRARPDEVRMILIDPKRVELNAYQGAPHLLSPVVTDPRRAAEAVQWCVKEMEQRYEKLALAGFRNIDGFNDAVKAGTVPDREGPIGDDGMPTRIAAEALPYILLVIDELADLMLVAPRDVEDAICRIAQMARAVGIHMVIATQRPSVDVITGLIKANIPSRLALQVASQTDSRTIIDANGAEKLVGKGDMLFLPASQGKPSRLQGCWVTEKEIAAAVAFCREQQEPQFEEQMVREPTAGANGDARRAFGDDSDEALLRRAAEQVVVSGLGSTSMLQRKLRIGFARAGRLMDELEELGVVGPNEGSKAREVLWSPEMLDDALTRGVL
ncbi:MAG: DNA translocase FtsK 4TM domain-containing protein [Nitriliruptoraceae bacterium]